MSHLACPLGFIALQVDRGGGHRCVAKVIVSLMLRKLGSFPRQNGLAVALRGLGRIERTRLSPEIALKVRILQDAATGKMLHVHEVDGRQFAVSDDSRSALDAATREAIGSAEDRGR